MPSPSPKAVAKAAPPDIVASAGEAPTLVFSITVASPTTSDVRPAIRIQRRAVLDSFTCSPFGEDDGAFSDVPGESVPGSADSVEAPLYSGCLLVECLERAEDALLSG